MLIFAGGNGRTRYRDGDIICNGPVDERTYVPGHDIQIGLPNRIAELEAAAADKGQTLFNGKQVRLCDYRYGGPSVTGGTSDKPLELRLGWTEYYHTRLTNGDRHFKLPITSKQLQGYPALSPFEGQPFAIDFTVESVCDWVRKHHLDHFDGRRGGVIGTTLFSLLQSLHYEFPDRWPEVIERLDDPIAK